MISPTSLHRLSSHLRWCAFQASQLFKFGLDRSQQGPDPNLTPKEPFTHNLEPLPRRATEAPRHPFDLQYGTDTGGFIDGADLVTGHPHDRYNTAYYAMSPRRFERAMDRWVQASARGPLEKYAFVDLGSGKGRAVLLASQLPFREIIGVELHPKLAQVAERNVRRWREGHGTVRPIKICCQDATEFRFPEGSCLLYIFHPFAAPVLDHLLSVLAEQFETRPNALDLLYFNPEHGDRIDRHPGFRHLWTEVLPVLAEEAATDTLANDGDLCSAYRWIGLRVLRDDSDKSSLSRSDS